MIEQFYLTGTTTLGQSVPLINGIEEVLNISQTLKLGLHDQIRFSVMSYMT